MAEAAGLVLGGLGVAGLFSVCVQAFDMVQLGRTQSHRLRILETKLDNQKARFIIWGQKHNLQDGQQYDRRLDESVRKGQIVKTCRLIIDLFTASEELKTRYGLAEEEDTISPRPLPLLTSGNDSSVFKLTFRRVQVALRKNDTHRASQGSSSRPHVVRWVIKDNKEFLSLIDDLKDLVSDLEALTAFPDLDTRWRDIARAEVRSISDHQSVRLLREAAEDEHDLLSEIASDLGDPSSQRSFPILPPESSRRLALDRDVTSQSQSFMTAPEHVDDHLSALDILEKRQSAPEDVPQHQRIMQGLGTVEAHQWRVQPPSSASLRARARFVQIHENNISALSTPPQDWPTNNSITNKRMCKELLRLSQIDLAAFETVTGAPLPGSNRMQFLCSIQGPPQTPYEEGIFHAMVICHPDYPFVPPLVRFMTRIYHPNIDVRGKVCCNILDKDWTGALWISLALISLTSLLSDPSVDDPLVPEIAATMIQDRSRYEQNVRKYTERFATGPVPTEDEARAVADAMVEEWERSHGKRWR